jgi:hypothetical protein
MPALRNRAYELADTGRYSDWDAIAVELAGESVPDVLVRRLRHYALFQVMIKNRISAARG